MDNEHICNFCGKSCTLGQGEFADRKTGLIGAEITGGYESTPGNGFGALDDCTSYRFNLCEFCLDWLFSNFRIPVNVIYLPDAEKDPWKPAAQRVAEDDWRKMKDEFFAEKERRDSLRGNDSFKNRKESFK